MSDLALESATKDFEAWRSAGKKCGRIPNHLKKVIQQLGDTIEPYRIANVLRLKETRVNQILGGPQISFVELPQKIWNTSTIPCIVQRKDGSKLTIEVNIQQVDSIIQAFLCCK